MIVNEGQVLESRELQRRARHKRQLELGGRAFQAWLGEWAQRKRAGEPIAVLVNADSTHVVVVATRRYRRHGRRRGA